MAAWRLPLGSVRPACTGKEEMSGMISEVFGADIEFQNAKLKT